MTLAHGLFSSCEILRQGPLDRWDAISNGWVQCHCVLTRSGFLHTCRGTDAPRCLPVESLSLQRYDFADVRGAVFHLRRVRHGWFGGRREPKVCNKHALQALVCMFCVPS